MQKYAVNPSEDLPTARTHDGSGVQVDPRFPTYPVATSPQLLRGGIEIIPSQFLTPTRSYITSGPWATAVPANYPQAPAYYPSAPAYYASASAPAPISNVSYPAQTSLVYSTALPVAIPDLYQPSPPTPVYHTSAQPHVFPGHEMQYPIQGPVPVQPTQVVYVEDDLLKKELERATFKLRDYGKSNMFLEEALNAESRLRQQFEFQIEELRFENKKLTQAAHKQLELTKFAEKYRSASQRDVVALRRQLAEAAQELSSERERAADLKQQLAEAKTRAARVAEERAADAEARAADAEARAAERERAAREAQGDSNKNTPSWHDWCDPQSPAEAQADAETRAAETETLRLQQERDAARADAAEARTTVLEKQLQAQTALVEKAKSEFNAFKIKFKELEKSINSILQNTATPTTISFQQLSRINGSRLEWKIDDDLKKPPEQGNYNINLKFEAFHGGKDDNTKQKDALTQIALLKLKLINLGMSNLNSSFYGNKNKITEMLDEVKANRGGKEDLNIKDSGTLKFCQDFFLLGQQIAKVEQATDKDSIFERVTLEFGKDLITFSNKNVKDFRKFKKLDEFKKELTPLCESDPSEITSDEKDKIILLNKLLIPLREACIGYDKIDKIKKQNGHEVEITSDFAKVFVDLSQEEADNIFAKLQDDQKIKLRKLISSELLYLETEKANVNKYVFEEGIKGWVQSFYKDKLASKNELEVFFQKKIDSCTEIISRHDKEWGVASDDQALSNPIINIKQSLGLLGKKIEEVASLINITILPLPVPSTFVQEGGIQVATVINSRAITSPAAAPAAGAPASPAAPAYPSPVTADADASAAAPAPAPAHAPAPA